MHAHNGSNEVAEWKIAHLLNYKVPIPDVGALLRFRHHRERAPSIDTERLNWRRVSAATDTRMDKNSARAPLWPRGRGLSLSFDTIHYFRGGGVSVCVFHYTKKRATSATTNNKAILLRCCHRCTFIHVRMSLMKNACTERAKWCACVRGTKTAKCRDDSFLEREISKCAFWIRNRCANGSTAHGSRIE